MTVFQSHLDTLYSYNNAANTKEGGILSQHLQGLEERCLCLGMEGSSRVKIDHLTRPRKVSGDSMLKSKHFRIYR